MKTAEENFFLNILEHGQRADWVDLEGKTVKLQTGGKALFIKADSVKWHFPLSN